MRTWANGVEATMNLNDMSLGDFVQQVLVQLRDAKMHFRDERPWHEFLYRLKKDQMGAGKPPFLDRLFFEWNGPYPRSPELSEFLHGLHWTGCLSAPNPSYDTFTTKPEVRAIWEEVPVDPEARTFLNAAGIEARRRLVVNGR
jgi:hypothetical protein